MRLHFILTLFILCTCISGCNNTVGSSNDDSKIIEIGDFRFGSFRTEILDVAKSYNYKVREISPCYMELKGEISALGVTWTKMTITHNDSVGIRQITLSRPLNNVSQEILDTHYYALKSIFPDTQKIIYSHYSIIGGDTSITSNYGDIFDINDSDIHGYSGHTYFLRDQNELCVLICTKN